MQRFAQATIVASILVSSICMPAPAVWGRRPTGPGGTNTFFVNAATGSDSSSCQSSATACRTIGAAIAKSGGRGTINVAAGTYAENLTLGSVQLTIVGAGSGTTAIDGGGNGQVINWAPSSPEGSTLSISGITIQNGSVTNGFGAGLYASGSAWLTLSNVVFQGHTCLANSLSSTCLGGGLYFFGVRMTATDVTFANNTADFGVGLFFSTRNPTMQSVLTRVTFTNNDGGGALYVMNDLDQTVTSAPLALDDVTFTNNAGSPAGDIVLCQAAFSGTAVTFSGNFGTSVSTDPGTFGGPCTS